jgi:LuxR family maltose regulon positive regulatory protein
MSRWYTLAQTALGFSLFLSGEPRAAEPLRKAIMSEASIPLARVMAFSVVSLVATEEGRIAQARELASAARRLSDDGDLSHTPQYSLAHTAAGAVHALEGRPQEARNEFEHSLRSHGLWPGLSPWITLETLLRLASLLLDIGDRAEAPALLDEARNILTSLPDGAEAQLSRLERLEQRITTRQSRVLSRSDTLTEREVAVLRLLGGTLSLREIGQELHLSQNTIKTHTQAIYRKLGVSTRHAAVEKGRETGVPLVQISLSSLARRTASPRRAADSLR